MQMNQHHLCFVLPDEPEDEDEYVDVTPSVTPSREPPPHRRRAFLEVLVHSSVYRFFESKFIRMVRFRQPKKLPSSVYLDTEGVQILEKFGGNSNPRNFSYSELYIGSKGFSKEEILGSGGFGRVYKAVLPSDDSVVAVKCLAERGDKFEKTFAAELLAMAHLRHRNLVSLRGWCLYDDQLFLVYDYMPNSSLDRLLFRQKGFKPLDWDMRVKIVNGLGAALFYLHEQLETQIIHRDVKASNVMLDSDYNARLGDFGLARWLEHEIDYKISAPSVKHEKQFLLPPDKFRLVDTTRIGGTIGYLPPENFQRHGAATAKGDVFSFGIVVLEIVAGRKAVDITHQDDRIVLLDWVRKLSDEGSVLVAGDRRIADGSYKDSDMEHLIHLGLLCTLHEPQSRPNMKWVMEVLSGNLCGKLPALPSFRHYPQYISVSSKDTDSSHITATGPSSATFTITTNTTDSVIGDSDAYFTAKGETLYASAETSPSRNGRSRSKAMPLINIPREVSFKEIISITNNFSESHKVAEVGFGTAYHGFLDKKKHVLVKRLGTTICPQVRSRFSYELENLGKLRHRNLVQLRGWCIENGEMLALYDHNATSLLSHSLFHPAHKRHRVLQWHQRYSIVKSLASAICYLHEEWDEQVLHKNISSSSIFLDSDSNPRLGNFALAQFLTRNEELQQPAPQKACGNDGMFGHMSPEYIITSKATTMSDIYSFGVVVIEVISGQMAVDFSRPEPLLIQRVNEFETRKRRYEELADHRLEGQYNHKELVRLVKLGMACTRSDPKERPSIKTILSILNGYDRCFLEKGLKKERKEEWKHNNMDSISLVKRLQALGIQ
ncbi:hypothetical protein DCAR_0833036 [Daucus carota subsp. sativus]|uniref:Protein kinase domain-containing protein n=2 Tax=Daucus carota subsp. sativus TaxID=79200 RepID=A0A175YRG3_DAUCS|nr:hypothetical protein DCAR_0833036 [Daucus carota subsp. sativus]